MPSATDAARAALLADYRTRLRQLDTLAPLRFARMADFDETLRPRVVAA